MKKSTTNVFIFSLHTVFVTIFFFKKVIYFKGITNSGIFVRLYYSAFVLSHSLLTKLVSIPKNLLSVFYSKMRVNLWDNLTSIYFRHGDHDRVGG